MAAVQRWLRRRAARPDLAAEYAAVEVRIDHRFRKDLSMAEIIEAAAVADAGPIDDWAA